MISELEDFLYLLLSTDMICNSIKFAVQLQLTGVGVAERMGESSGLWWASLLLAL
jgi:hypothetical protein